MGCIVRYGISVIIQDICHKVCLLEDVRYSGQIGIKGLYLRPPYPPVIKMGASSIDITRYAYTCGIVTAAMHDYLIHTFTKRPVTIKLHFEGTFLPMFEGGKSLLLHNSSAIDV